MSDNPKTPYQYGYAAHGRKLFNDPLLDMTFMENHIEPMGKVSATVAAKEYHEWRMGWEDAHYLSQIRRLKPVKRFFKDRKYMGIRFNKPSIHVGLPRAQESGVKEVFTRTGPPLNRTDADQWVELEGTPGDWARSFEFAARTMRYRQTNRVVVCENAQKALACGYDLITIEER